MKGSGASHMSFVVLMETLHSDNASPILNMKKSSLKVVKLTQSL